MKIEITTTGDAIEKFNYFIGIAIDQAKNKDDFLKSADLTLNDIDKIDDLRKSILDGYFKKMEK